MNLKMLLVGSIMLGLELLLVLAYIFAPDISAWDLKTVAISFLLTIFNLISIALMIGGILKNE